MQNHKSRRTNFYSTENTSAVVGVGDSQPELAYPSSHTSVPEEALTHSLKATMGADDTTDGPCPANRQVVMLMNAKISN